MNFASPTPDMMARLRSRVSRRRFLRQSAIAGAVAAVAPTTSLLAAPKRKAAATFTDLDILNFALNLEYLEAEFYANAYFGRGLDSLGIAVTGTGNAGTTTVKSGSTKVDFSNVFIKNYAAEIVNDEIAHVRYLRSALGNYAIARPPQDLLNSFNALAVAAGLGSSFDPFASQENFLLGSFIFEDVGVTAYLGAAPLIVNPDYINPAGGILVAEAVHASTIRTTIYGLNYTDSTQALALAVNKISDLRDSLDGSADLDQGITAPDGTPNIVPTDANSLCFPRTTRQVLNIVYGNINQSGGGFFPQGVNGVINS